MKPDLFRQYGSGAALAAGGLLAAAFACLVLFFTIELPQGPASPLPFSFLSDLLPVLAALPALLVCVAVFQAQFADSPQRSIFTLCLGISGWLVFGVAHLLFVLQRITLEQQSSGYMLSMAPLGLWHILANRLARRSGRWPARLADFGALVGAAQLLTFVSMYVLGGYGVLFNGSSGGLTGDLPRLALVAVALPAGLLSYSGLPAWLLWWWRATARTGQVEALPARARQAAN